MIESLRQLLDLQRLDDELLALTTEQAAIPARRARCQATREAGEARLAEAKQSLTAAELRQRESEQSLQDQDSLLKRLEGQQFQVKSNEAYTALLREMEAAKLAISDAETRILEAMEVLERARQDLAAAEREVAEERAAIEVEEAALAKREQELEQLLAGIGARRAALARPIEKEVLERYERVASRRRPAVVVLTKETCGGCQVGIPPQTYIEVLRAHQVVTCGQCHRILVHEQRLAAASG